MNNTTKVILGMAVAAAAGAAIGMLLAPEKGVDLQKQIKDGAANWMSDFNGLLNTGKDVMNEFKSKTALSVTKLQSGLQN